MEEYGLDEFTADPDRKKFISSHNWHELLDINKLDIMLKHGLLTEFEDDFKKE